MSAWRRYWAFLALLGAAWLVGCGSDDDDDNDDDDAFYGSGGTTMPGVGGTTTLPPVTTSTGGRATVPVATGGRTSVPVSTGGTASNLGCPSSMPANGSRCDTPATSVCPYNGGTTTCVCSVNWSCIDTTGSGGWGQVTGGSGNVAGSGSGQAGAGAVACPTSLPDNGDDCALPGQLCEVEGLDCVCSVNGWRCTVPQTAQGGAGGVPVTGPTCPDEAPDTGDDCSGSAAGEFCPYDESTCICTNDDSWLCQLTPQGGGGAGNGGTGNGGVPVVPEGGAPVVSQGGAAGTVVVVQAGEGGMSLGAAGTTMSGGGVAGQLLAGGQGGAAFACEPDDPCEVPGEVCDGPEPLCFCNDSYVIQCV